MPSKESRSAALTVFGQRVRELRLQQGLTQERLAEHAGMHRTHITALEGGKRNVALLGVVRLATAVGVDPADLTRGLDAFES